jgi:hypothetical protein
MLAVPYPMQVIANFFLTVDTRLSERSGHVGVVEETAAVRRGYLWEILLFFYQLQSHNQWRMWIFLNI